MSLFDLSFSNYSINNDMIHLEENEEASFINEHELEQCQTPQDKDLFFPRCSSQFHEFLLHEEEEEESRHPSLEDLTQSILDYQNLINDEKPLSQTILPILEQNNESKNNDDPKIEFDDSIDLYKNIFNISNDSNEQNSFYDTLSPSLTTISKINSSNFTSDMYYIFQEIFII